MQPVTTRRNQRPKQNLGKVCPADSESLRVLFEAQSYLGEASLELGMQSRMTWTSDLPASHPRGQRTQHWCRECPSHGPSSYTLRFPGHGVVDNYSYFFKTPTFISRGRSEDMLQALVLCLCHGGSQDKAPPAWRQAPLPSALLLAPVFPFNAVEDRGKLRNSYLEGRPLTLLCTG